MTIGLMSVMISTIQTSMLEQCAVLAVVVLQLMLYNHLGGSTKYKESLMTGSPLWVRR